MPSVRGAADGAGPRGARAADAARGGRGRLDLACHDDQHDGPRRRGDELYIYIYIYI